MITETPNIQRQVQPEGRFVTLLKNEFIKHAKEINRLHKTVEDIETGDVDLQNYYTKQQTEREIYSAINDIVFPIDTNTTYELIKSNTTITLTGSDGSQMSVTDVGTQDTRIPTSTIDSLF